jgi:hypothetical protein
MIKIRVEAEVRPTEDIEKVKRCINNIIDIQDLRIAEIDQGANKLLVGEARKITPLFKLYELLRRERILDAARHAMISSKQGNMLMLRFHKQSAFAGHVSLVTFDEESPMGPITLTIISDKIDDIIDWLAPKTSKGRPLWEKEVPKV